MTKFIKIVLVLIICTVSYVIGWGNGQSSAYDKIENSTPLDVLYSK